MAQHDDVDYKEELFFILSDIEREVEAYLESNHANIEQAYKTGYPTVQKLIGQPKEVGDLIDVALILKFYLNDTHALLYGKKERRTTMPLEFLMYNIGLFWGYFAEHTGIVMIPVDLEARYRSRRAAEDGLKPHEPRLARIDEVLAEPKRILEDSYAEGDDLTQVEATDWLLDLYPNLIEEIVEAMNPPTIRTRRHDEWTADDKKYYARKRLMKALTPIAREHNRVFGDRGVRKSKD